MSGLTERDLIPRLRLDLIRDEGVVLKPYRDTVGKLTIGVGRNLDDVGITQEEALYLLTNDIDRHIKEALRVWPWLEKKPIKIRLAIYNMAFNLGIPRLRQFIKMMDAIYKDDYKTAAREALDSKWAKQVGKRADRIVQFMEEATLD